MKTSVNPFGRAGTMAGTLAALFAAGATLAFVSLALPHPARTDELGIVVTAAVAYVVGAGLFLGSGRLPRLAFVLGVGCGSVRRRRP